jgi:hypothetical protein
MRTSLRGALGVALATAYLGNAACAAKSSDEKPVFGGEGAKVLDEKPLPPGAGDPEALGPCGKASPASDASLIDDFEDGNDRIFKAFERDGFWFGAGDKTEGSKLSNAVTFAPELLPEAEAKKDNRYAAHLTASGQTNWGVVWGTALQWTKQGIKCPVNLSAFAGVRFRAKGPGQIRVSLAVPEVTPKEHGGTCTDRCYDGHGRLISLSEAWDSYELRWEKLAQGGWGTEARFTPERLVNVNFNVDVKALPIDFWLDDVELIAKAAPPTGPAH